MKKLITTLILLSLTTPLQAEGFFKDALYGVAIINQNIDLKFNDGTTTSTSSDSATGIGVYLDKYYKRTYRLNGTWSYIPYDDFAIRTG